MIETAYYWNRPKYGSGDMFWDAFYTGDFDVCFKYALNNISYEVALNCLEASFLVLHDERIESSIPQQIINLRNRTDGRPEEILRLNFFETIVNIRSLPLTDQKKYMRSIRKRAIEMKCVRTLWDAHFMLIEIAHGQARFDEVKSLVEESKKYDLDDIAYLRINQYNSWNQIYDSNDAEQVRLELQNLDFIENNDVQHAFYEIITLRHLSSASLESDKFEALQRAESRLNARVWNMWAQPYNTIARISIAWMNFLHGFNDESLLSISKGLNEVFGDYDRLCLFVSGCRFAEYFKDESLRQKYVKETLNLVCLIDWRTRDRVERLQMLQAAFVLGQDFPEESHRIVNLYNSLRNFPRRHSSYRAYTKSITEEQMLSGLISARFGNSFEAISKLTSATFGWQKLNVPYRSAISAFHLAEITKSKSDISFSLRLLEKWPNCILSRKLDDE